jgi:hypothetical protein
MGEAVFVKYGSNWLRDFKVQEENEVGLQFLLLHACRPGCEVNESPWPWHIWSKSLEL